MTKKPEERLLSATNVRRSLWHWDLWAATIGGLVVGVGWFLTDYEPQWGWIVPVITLSVAMAHLAWGQWNSLRSQLRRSDYGELLRLADESETEVKLPYFITLFVALFSAFCSTITAIVIEGLNRKWAEAVLLGLTGFFAALGGTSPHTPRLRV